MLLKRLKLVNYGGIYNGLGLYEIEIDFTKCKNRIVLIKGDNGSGKSTIESALKPLPDDNTSFINGKDALKEIEYIDESSGMIYSIKFIHECKGSSRTSKGYFYKISPNGNIIDCNPSGNITSCKEEISNELELDSNYIALTQLSNTKRGIADLRPADRKRFVNNILSSTEVYNSMYKNLSKRSSNLKSLMSNISSKIDSVGNVVQLEQELKSTESKITEVEERIDQQTEIINKERGMLLSIDPGNELGQKIVLLSDKRKEYSQKRDSASKKLNSMMASTPSLSTVSITKEMLDELNVNIFNFGYEIKNLKNSIASLITEREKDASNLEDETAKLKALDTSVSNIELARLRGKLNVRKTEIENRWGEIVDLTTVTVDEFMNANNVINLIAELILHTEFVPGDINQLYLSTLNDIESVENEIFNLDSYMDSIETYEYRVEILNERPSNCKDDSCPFIADALKAKAKLNELLSKQSSFKMSKSQLTKKLSHLKSDLSNIENLRQINNLYTANSIILNKLNLGLDTFEDCFISLKTNLQQILTVLNGLIEYANDLNEYKVICKDIDEVNSKSADIQAKSNIIDMVQASIEKLNSQLDADNKRIDEMNEEILIKSKKCTEMQTLFETLSDVFNLRAEIAECDEAISIIDSEINDNKYDIDKIEKLNSDIDKLTVSISELKAQLGPLRKSAETLRYKLTLSEDYTKEYAQYNSMYNKIETLKYYCSPTTGIQLVFANMYLSKIMENANSILSKLFNGTFALLPLIISETEFRIPVAVNGGINHDDITSMSSAQIALISMIISISLLSQTSTKLNIIVGDEIDAPFDSENRREFINILTQLMGLVNSSQCVLISHNSEIPMHNCDIILLKNDNDVITEGNVIWSYR